MGEEPEVVRGKALSAEEQYFYERSYQEPVEAAGRMEDAAKALAAVTAAVSGLFLSAFKLSLGTAKPDGWLWIAPFVCWTLSCAALVGVLVPMRYAAGSKEPEAWRQAFERARDWKYRLLVAGAVLLMLGILSGVATMVA